MPWFLSPHQAAGGVLALEALRLVRACFRIRRSSFGRAPVDSHDALSVFEAMDVDNRAYDRGAPSRGPRFMHGCSRYVRQLGYPLLIPSTIFYLYLCFLYIFQRLRVQHFSSYD